MDIIELGNLSYRLEAGRNAARAIHEAMINGDCEPEGWLDSLHYVLYNLSDDAKALRELTERNGNGGAGNG